MAIGSWVFGWAVVLAVASGVAAQEQSPETDPATAAVRRLIDAAEKGNAALVREALARGVSPVASLDCSTALTKAAELGRSDILKILIPNADINAHDPLCPVALFFAASNGQGEAARMLLAAGAKPNIKSTFGDTALLAALREGHREIASDLIAAGASVLIPSRRRESALLIAVQRNDADMVETLIRKGADPHLPSMDGLTPLTAAAAIGNERVINSLLAEGVDVDDTDAGSITPLMRAAEFGHLDAMRVLLSHGADAMAYAKGARGGRGATVLDVAIDADQKPAVQLLLAGPLRLPRKAEVQTASGSGNPPSILPLPDIPPPTAGTLDHGLRLAAMEKRTAIVKLLLEAGADVRSQGDCGRTALMEAADSGDTEAAEQLLMAGADPKAGETVDAQQGCTGWNVLMAAASQGRLKMLNALLESGAGPLVNKHDVSGRTALDLLPQTSMPPRSESESNPEMTDTALKAVRQRLTDEARRQSPDMALADPESSDSRDGGRFGRIISRPALERLRNLARTVPSRGGEAVLRARIAAAAGTLLGRWPAPTGMCPYGVCSAQIKRVPLQLTEYGFGLTRDVLLLEIANRSSTAGLLDAVAQDLEVKVRDCLTRGENAGGESAITFRFETLRSGGKVTNWTLYFMDRQNYALAKMKRPVNLQDKFKPSLQASWAAESLMPGNYLMYVGWKGNNRPEMRTGCAWVEVQTGKSVKSFEVGGAAPNNGCRPLW